MGNNATLLSWIVAEVDQALTLVREQIAKFSAGSGDAALLASCPVHLHQVSGALRMVGLAGATRFCELIESGFAAPDGAPPGAAALAVIDRAIQALKEFVDGLERGQANVPLRLFPLYRELATLQGRLDSTERDLFFPDLSPAAPPHIKPKTLAADKVAAHVQKQRVLFQRGLLAWLRSSTKGGLDDMRRAANQLHKVATQLPEPQAVWWVAGGMLESLEHPQTPEWVAQAKALGSRIEKQMREGSPAVSEALLRELLYAVAKAQGPSQRVKQVRQLYQLDSLFPEPPKAVGALEFDLDWLEPALYDLHSRLDALKGAWVQYVAGEQKTATRFRELVAPFKAKAVPLGNQHLIKLLDAIALVTKHLPDPFPRQKPFMVIEMASAFLLIESVIDHFTDPPPDLEQQIVIMGGWLLDAALGKSTGEPPAGLRADLSEQIGALQLRARVAKEIAANLQHVEQVLDGFARDPSKRDALPGLQPHLRQINGALTVLRFEQAARVLALCERLIGQCSAPNYANAADDMDWIAEGLSSIGIFLEPCQQGREPAEHAIELFFRRHDRAHMPVLERGMDTTMVLSASAIKKAAASAAEAAAPAASAEPAVPPPAPPARSTADRELLDIYLEEAGEVLGNIQAALVECRAQPQDLDVLTTIRRGFHTLKGSGRMVGLMDLGEVAWEVEQVMNRWLQMKWPASAELLDLLTRASASFAGWIAQLRDGSLAGEIKAQDIVALAVKLRAAEESSAPAAPVAVPTAAPAAPVANPALEATALPEEVMVGEVRLARHMFDIYLKEAREHAATLASQYDAWRGSPGEASREFVRAAHTLASSSQTAGFASIASLSAALEQWMPLAPLSAAAVDAKLVKKAIKGLRERVESVDRRVAPAQSGKTEAALRQLTARLLTLSPAPVSAPASAQVQAPEPAPAAEMPPTPAPAAGGRAQRVMRDDIDPQLLPIFLEEAQHLLPLVGSDLRDWKAHPEDEKVLQSLQRALHTLKGSARMAGAIRLGELTHVMEGRIEAALEAGAINDALFVELEEKMDRLSLDLERMAAGPEPVAEAQPAAATTTAVAEAPRAEPPLPSPAAMLRINADTLDHLINESGEVTIARTRVEAELRGVKQSIVDLSESIARLRAQLREVEIQADSQMQARKSELEERNREFDPLEFDRYTRLQELTRLMAESLHDAASIQQSLSKNLGETDAALIHQARTSRDVQQELMRMRAVPFSILEERLYRIVRQTTRELDKKAELHIEGSQVEMDRSVLERIGAPLEHMLRNALSHGLEMPAARAAAGKPEAGRLSVSLRQEGNEIALIVSDDGAGLDLERLRRKAEDKGFLQAGQEVAETELMQLIFVSGLSTADAVTELAGRGIGMDVVRNEIAAIGGRVDIASERGRGTTFTVYLPLTLAVTQAVLVRAGGGVLAVSAAMVEQVLRLKAEALAERYAAQSVEFQDRRYPLHGLGQLLGAGAAPAQTYNSVLLLRSGVQRIALHVDEMLGQHEIVVKNIGPQLARVPGAAGATVLADGSIVLIVNPVQLVQHARATSERAASPAAAPVAVAPAAPVVMVVDDSLTVRKITGRLLEREGYQVLTAKDGLDALAQMKDALPDVMLVDIEMPRMDGFDLTRNLRGDPRTRGVPIIMISSRTAEKHRSQAAELGVNVFLGKPYPEAELLQHIAGYVKDRQAVTPAAAGARNAPADARFQPQARLGKYSIIREIGMGATSRVFLASDPFGDREVAIKVFHFDRHTDPQSERMTHKAFLAEASLAGKLNHPHIVEILDAVAEPDYSYVVMEYVAGPTLDAHSGVTNLLPLGKVVEIIFKCIRALEYAFQHGVIHRDIKPGNILLSDAGETKVSDFGASFQQHYAHDTTQLSGVGSPAYMSPEQVRIAPLTHQTDIYSLGVTMYRLLTGRLPFQASTQESLVYAILNTEPPRPATLRPELPALLDHIVMTAMNKDPARRYGSWLDFGKDLSQAFSALRLVGASLSDSEKFNELRQMPFFQGMGDVALWEVVRIGSWKKVAAGSVIIREGDQGDSFYLLISGEVAVTLSGTRLNTIKPGGCFGEILYFTDRIERRTTTITAQGEVTMIEIKADALRVATDACQVGFNKAFMRVLIERLMQANQRLAERG